MKRKTQNKQNRTPATDITEFDDCVFAADAWIRQAEHDQKHFHALTDAGKILARNLLWAARWAFKLAMDARSARIALLRSRGDEPWSHYGVVE